MCCLFGLIDYKNCLSVRNKEVIIKVLANECEARGTDATGVAYITEKGMTIYKKAFPAHNMKFKFKSDPKVIMGHTRMTTQGSEKINANNHPFYSEKLGFALAHNGVLYGERYIRKAENLPDTDIETDSYIAVQLIDKQNTLNFKSLKYMAEKIEGSFCFTVLSKDNELYFVKGDNPMCIAHFNGFYIYASTKEILTKALKKLGLKKYKEVSIKEGEILKINADGSRERDEFNMNYCYGYGWYDYGGRPYYYGYGRKKNKEFTDEYLEELVACAKSKGIDKSTVYELFDMGYDYLDIEEMIYDPALMYYSLHEEELYDEI